MNLSAPRGVPTKTPSTSNTVEVQRSRKRRECQFAYVVTNQYQDAEIVKKSVAANTHITCAVMLLCQHRVWSYKLMKTNHNYMIT